MEKPIEQTNEAKLVALAERIEMPGIVIPQARREEVFDHFAALSESILRDTLAHLSQGNIDRPFTSGRLHSFEQHKDSWKDIFLSQGVVHEDFLSQFNILLQRRMELVMLAEYHGANGLNAIERILSLEDTSSETIYQSSNMRDDMITHMIGNIVYARIFMKHGWGIERTALRVRIWHEMHEMFERNTDDEERIIADLIDWLNDKYERKLFLFGRIPYPQGSLPVCYLLPDE
jgi:hypothetical protein